MHVGMAQRPRRSIFGGTNVMIAKVSVAHGQGSTSQDIGG
jgi:hypothetical protein